MNQEPASRQSLRHIVDEHRHLEGILDRVENATLSWQLGPLLEELHKVLRDHFEAEEQPGGFLESARSRSQEHAARVARLMQEHQQVLGDLDALVAEMADAPERPPEELLERVRKVCRLMRRHEFQESKLLEDVGRTGNA